MSYAAVAPTRMNARAFAPPIGWALPHGSGRGIAAAGDDAVVPGPCAAVGVEPDPELLLDLSGLRSDDLVRELLALLARVEDDERAAVEEATRRVGGLGIGRRDRHEVRLLA